MARTKPSDILAALDRIYTHKERKDAAEQNMALRLMTMEYNKDAREDDQEFRRETVRMNTKLQYETMYPGVQFKEDGYTPDLENYDMTQTTSYKVSNLTGSTDQLREWGVSTDGTDDEIQQRHATYLQARAKGQHIMAPFISSGTAVRSGYDASPGYLTQQDVVDFEDQFYGAGGPDNPIALQQLIDAGIISTDNLELDDNGLWSAPDDKTKDLITTSLQGLKAGVQANRNYKTTDDYELALKNKRMDAALFAETMTGHPGVVMATRELTGAAKAVGQNYIGYAINPESGQATMLWKGEIIAREDLPKAISNLKGFSPDEKTLISKYYEVLAGVGADGSNIAPALDAIGADAKLLKLIGRVDVGLATSLKKALRQYQRLNKVSEYAGGFIDQPQDVRKVTEFREYITGTGLSQRLQKQRTMQAEQNTESPEYAELKNEITAIVKGIKGNLKGDKKMIKDFRRWLELEEVTASLFMESAQKRRK